MYGTTFAGGSQSSFCTQDQGCGTIFKLTPSGSGYTETIIHIFQPGTDGLAPVGALISVNGELYGVTEYGGTSASGCLGGCGAVFEASPSGAEQVVYSFQGGTDGQFPLAGLTYENGSLFGTTANGGGTQITCTFGCGTVFEVTP
jgi:uncharacterized repeat protein (TIGR03803 family)